MTDEERRMSPGRPLHASSGPRRDAIIALHQQGLKGVAIARTLGITPGAVSYHLKKYQAAINRAVVVVDRSKTPEEATTASAE